MNSKIKNIFCILSLFVCVSTVTAVEPVLMRAGPYEFGVSDFEHVYFKNNLNGKQRLDDCLSLYVPYKLKLIAAREAGLDTLPAITCEWTKYRDQLANKYLMDSIVSGNLLSEVYDRSRYEPKVAHILLMNDDRLWVGIDRFVAKLKERYHFTEDTVLLKNLFCDRQYTNYGDRTLFSFAGRNYSMHDFERFATSVGHARKPSFTTVEQAYDRYVAQSLLEYENDNLESNSGEFRDITDEYLNGLLLFGISQREVWSKASQDSAGLADFYKKNAKSYRWEKRLDATVYYCSDQKVATRISLTVNNKNAGLGHLPNGLFTFFCNPDGVNPCVDTVRQVFPKGLKTIADQVKWKKGCSKILEWNGKFVFLDVHDILRPARKTFEEARAEAVADYQKVLEKQWVEQLKKTYPVAIDEVAWADLKKKYAK